MRHPCFLSLGAGVLMVPRVVDEEKDGRNCVVEFHDDTVPLCNRGGQMHWIRGKRRYFVITIMCTPVFERLDCVARKFAYRGSRRLGAS